MKTVISLFLLGFAFARPVFGQWAVFDAANLTQSITNYATLVEQLAKQAEQISNQVRQIDQMENQLQRLGNMKDIKAIIGFPQLKLDLSLPTKIRTWAETVESIDGAKLFGDTRDGIFRAVTADFPDFDGRVIVREADTYKPAQEIAARVDEFNDVQTDVYARRAELKKAIATTSEALQAAETDAAEKKLSAVLGAQYDQLASLDAEVSLSAAEVQVRAAESVAMTTAQDEADAEARQKLAQKEAEKIGTAFKPIYEQVLLYVREEPFRP